MKRKKDKDAPMVISGFSEGDWSVGIPRQEFEIKIGNFTTKEYFETASKPKEERERLRKEIEKFIGDVHDNGRVHVVFDDESEDYPFTSYMREAQEGLKKYLVKQKKKIEKVS